MKDVAIIVPYRNRQEHAEKFIPHMNRFLQGENLSFTIYLIEQDEEKPFNRAKLLNVGYDLTRDKYKNYVFHDVDMLPVEGRASYQPVETPTHYAAIVEQFGWSLAYPAYVGGVTAFDAESFEKINGFCNEYWGWGAEDDDLFRRCDNKGIQFQRRQNMYASLNHDRPIVQELYDNNIKVLREWESRLEDGLSNLDYKVLNCAELETHKTYKVKI